MRRFGEHTGTSPARLSASFAQTEISPLQEDSYCCFSDPIPLPHDRPTRLPTVRTFACKHLPAPTMPPADFCTAIGLDHSPPSPSSADTAQTSPGKTHSLRCVDAKFIKHAPTADGGLCCHLPAGPKRTTPHIRFLFVAPHLWVELPADPASRQRPCPSPSLRLRVHLVRGLQPRKLCAMHGKHDRS